MSDNNEDEAPSQPPPTPRPPKKSVSWSLGTAESDDSAKNKSDSSSHRNPLSLSNSTIPKLKSSRRSQSRRSLKSTSAWWRKNLICCAPSMDTESEEEYDDFTPSKMKLMSEDELISRLQQAVHELGHRPHNYDIDSEILRYQRTLEIEHMLYEKSGKPKFKYKWFRKNQYLTPKKHPLYGTNYENHRKLEVRLEEFRFGAANTHEEQLGNDVKYGRQRDSYESKNATYWRSTSQVFYANMALLCGASNFLRFPQACYANGGFTFLLTYCLLIAAIGQPLLFFEMVLGQLSVNGPSGFARLHPYAKGIPYAIAFVCVFFGTARSVYLAYCILYAVISLIASPGRCGWWTSGGTKCVSYESFEEHKDTLQKERMNANNASANEGNATEVSIFSVELFFREVMLDADWKSGTGSFVNYKLVIAYVFICGVALIPIQYNLTGRSMKTYLRYALLLPIVVSLLFLHQICFRGAMSTTISYFLQVDRNHVSALNIWSEAFDMVLSTLGIGYGFHWSISGNVSIDYKETYRTSWRMCGFAVLFGMMSSLVLFCEIGIVGEFTGDHSHYHVFYERIGITFVCYSGALLKLGGGSVFFVSLFFFIFVIYGMWSQIIVADIILRYLEQGHIIKGYRRQIAKRKKRTICYLIGLQLVVITPYAFAKGSSVLASENVFGGSLAAYLVVLIELVIAVYLYGLPRFLADVEIMTKRPLSALFQIQIRYVGIPTILIFMVPFMLNVYLYPSLYSERNNIGWLFYMGLLANFAPIAIMLLAFPVDFVLKYQASKVNPMPFLHPGIGTKAMEELREKYPLVEPLFVSKVDAPSQQTPHRTIRSEIYHVVEHNMDLVHKCQAYVKEQFNKLLVFKTNQARWVKLSLAVLGKKKVKSFRRLVQRLMMARKYRNDKVDIHFLDAALEQIVNLNFYSAMRKLQRMPMEEMLLYLADQLLKITTFRLDNEPYDVYNLSSSSESSSSSSDESDDFWNNNMSSSSSEDKPRKRYLQVHRKLVGQMEKSSEESRTLLTIRLKRGLGLPHAGEMSVLKFLRRQRAKQERELSCWTQTDIMPIDHFIPSSISNKKKEKICFTIFHGVVVEGSDHFALKKLPVPRPPIVRVTKSFVQSQPGNTLTDKFAHIVTKRMHRNIGRILAKRDLRNMSKKKLRRHLWKVSDRVDDDVYDFLDRILTCVIVLVSDEEANKRIRKPMYLTPRTRRKGPQNQGADTGRRRALTVTEIESYAALNYKQLQEQYWRKLLEQSQPNDIRYHDPDTDSGSSLEEEEGIEALSSSGSTSTLEEEEVEIPSSRRSSVTRGPSTASIATVGKADRLISRYVLENETLLQRDKRLLQKKSGFGISGLEESKEDLNVCVSADKIKHISARRWKHERDHNRQKEWFTENEITLQETVDMQASQHAIQAVASKSMEALTSRATQSTMSTRRAVSLQSLRHLLDSQAEFKVDLSKGEIVAIPKDKMNSTRLEEKLKNSNPDQSYLAFGKMLIVDHGMKLGSSTSRSKAKLKGQLLFSSLSS